MPSDLLVGPQEKSKALKEKYLRINLCLYIFFAIICDITSRASIQIYVEVIMNPREGLWICLKKILLKIYGARICDITKQAS